MITPRTTRIRIADAVDDATLAAIEHYATTLPMKPARRAEYRAWTTAAIAQTDDYVPRKTAQLRMAAIAEYAVAYHIRQKGWDVTDPDLKVYDSAREGSPYDLLVTQGHKSYTIGVKCTSSQYAPPVGEWVIRPSSLISQSAIDKVRRSYSWLIQIRDVEEYNDFTYLCHQDNDYIIIDWVISGNPADYVTGNTRWPHCCSVSTDLIRQLTHNGRLETKG